MKENRSLRGAPAITGGETPVKRGMIAEIAEGVFGDNPTETLLRKTAALFSGRADELTAYCRDDDHRIRRTARLLLMYADTADRYGRLIFEGFQDSDSSIRAATARHCPLFGDRGRLYNELIRVMRDDPVLKVRRAAGSHLHHRFYDLLPIAWKGLPDTTLVRALGGWPMEGKNTHPEIAGLLEADSAELRHAAARSLRRTGDFFRSEIQKGDGKSGGLLENAVEAGVTGFLEEIDPGRDPAVNLSAALLSLRGDRFDLVPGFASIMDSPSVTELPPEWEPVVRALPRCGQPGRDVWEALRRRYKRFRDGDGDFDSFISPADLERRLLRSADVFSSEFLSDPRTEDAALRLRDGARSPLLPRLIALSGMAGWSDWVPFIEIGIAGEDPQVREESITAWCRVCPGGSPDILGPSLRDPVWNVRKAAARALATMTEEKGRNTLIAFLSADEEGEEAVMEGICSAGSKAVRQLLSIESKEWSPANRGRLLAKGLDGDGALALADGNEDPGMSSVIAAAGPRAGPALVVGWDRAEKKQKGILRDWISLCGWDRRAVAIIDGRDTGERRALLEMVETRDKQLWFHLLGDALDAVDRTARARVRRVLKSVSRRRRSSGRNPRGPGSPRDRAPSR